MQQTPLSDEDWWNADKATWTSLAAVSPLDDGHVTKKYVQALI